MDKEDYEMMEDRKQKGQIITGIKKSIRKVIVMILIIGVIASVGSLFIPQLLAEQKGKEEILTTATLKKIINISELSTFQAVYNGIAQVMNEKKPEKVDYYVSYEAKIYAGLDFEDVDVKMNKEAKKITVTIPEIEVTEVNVNIASLDYIFINKKSNNNTVSAQAYKACIADATYESNKEEEIYDLAEQNAKNIVKALISPFIDQLDYDYELEIN